MSFKGDFPLYNEKERAKMEFGKDPLERVEAVVTILVDNTVMELIPENSMIERISRPQTNFIAEHGFSALIEVDGKRILVDTGATGIALEHNLTLVGLTLDDIDIVFLSHGHSDHTGGLHRVKGGIIAHPDVFHERYLEPKEGIRFDLSTPNSESLMRKTEFFRGPVKLVKGVMTTGEIPRIHVWEELKVFKIKKNGVMKHDRVLDDQGIIINTEEGLVIVAGCSHAGIINTIEHSISISGINSVYCVIGGFHLIGPGEEKIERTIEEFKRLNVKKIVPIHCTGFEGIKRISNEMPEEFEYVTAGCRLHFP